MPKRLEGSYCPLCGEKDLFLKKHKGATWAYCGLGGDGPDTSHTAFIVADDAPKAPDPEPEPPAPTKPENDRPQHKPGGLN